MDTKVKGETSKVVHAYTIIYTISPERLQIGTQTRETGWDKDKRQNKFPIPPSHLLPKLLASEVVSLLPRREVAHKKNLHLRCDYHSGESGHDTDQCHQLRYKIHRLIRQQVLTFHYLTEGTFDNGKDDSPRVSSWEKGKLDLSHFDNQPQIGTMLQLEGQNNFPMIENQVSLNFRVSSEIYKIISGINHISVPRNVPLTLHCLNLDKAIIWNNQTVNGEIDHGKKIINHDLSKTSGPAHEQVSLLDLVMTSKGHQDMLFKILGNIQVPCNLSPEKFHQIIKDSQVETKWKSHSPF